MLFIALIATLCLSATAKVPAERLAAMTARKMDHRSASGMFPMERLAIVPNEAHLRAEDTTDPGFIVGYAFDDSSSCGGQATYTFGVLTNTCMVSMPSDTATVPVKSYYYTCTEDSFIQTVYASSNCDATTVFNTSTISNICEVDGSSSQQMVCYPDTSYVAFTSAYVLTQYYDGSGCNTVYSFDGELNAYCYVEGAESNFYAYPTAYHYDGNSGCSGVPSYTYALNDNANECLLQTDINDDDSLNPSYSYLTLANSVPPKYSNDDDDLSGGAIAGISIGCVAFVGIVCALMYYFFIAKQAPMAAAAATPATATVSARATPVVVHATPTKPGVPVNEI